MSSDHSLLHNVLLSKCVINVLKLVATWELVVWVQRMRLSFGLWTFLKRIWLCANNIVLLICFPESSSIASMEISKTLRANSAPVNIRSGQRSVHKIRVFPCGRQDDWRTASDVSDCHLLFVFVSRYVDWLQWICMPGGLEVHVGHISVIHLIENLGGASFSSASCVSLPSRRALNIFYVHNVPRRKVELLLFQWAGSRDVINVHLVSDKFQFLWFHICNSLQIVARIEWVSSYS